MKNIKIFLLKIFNFYNLRKICILHGRVFVMSQVCVTDLNRLRLCIMRGWGLGLMTSGT